MPSLSCICLTCRRSSISSGGTKRELEKWLKSDGWMFSKGAWYCPDHRPFGNKDKAPIFRAQYELLAQDITDRPAPKLKPRFLFDPPTKREADFKIDGHPILVEVDGGQFKSMGGRHNGDADREKINRAVVLGYRVLRFSTQQLERDPYGCVYTTLQAIGLIDTGVRA